MKRSLVLSAIFSFILASQLNAGIHGTGMGGIKSVTSEGPADISRNPALLGTMTAEKSLALFATARAYTLYDIDLEIYFNDIFTNVDLDDPLYLGGSIMAAYAFKSGTSTYGISLEGYEGNLVSHETGKQTYGGTIDSKTKKITINPAINMAMGWDTGNNSFWGLQVILGNKYETEETKEPDSKTENINQKHSVELGMGYNYRDAKTEIGILLRTGTFSLEKKKRDKDFSSGLSDSNSTEYWPKYDKGIQLITGAYTKINEKTGIAMEFGYRFPVTFVDKSLSNNDDVSTVYEDTIPVSSKGGVLLNGGFEYFLSDTSTVNSGLGYQYYSAEGRDDGNVNKLSLSVLLWTVGYNRQLSPESELSLLLITFRQRGEAMSRFEDDSFSYELDSDDIRYAFEIGGGITRTF